MNVEDIRRLARRMRRLRHEEHYNQNTFAIKTGCGWTGCIAFHAVMMADGKLPADEGDGQEVAARAEEILGLKGGDLFTGLPSFYWPAEFAERWENRYDRRMGKDPSRRPSRIAADLLDAIADRRVAV